MTAAPAPVFDDNPEDNALPTFVELGLPTVLATALSRRGIDKPFPIQAAAIPDILAGRDVLGRGKTGSGKTLAFGLPLLARIAGQKAAPKRPRALILVPTRELAQQVQNELEPLGRGLGLRFKTVIGQTSMFKQIDALRRGTEVLVATPGRLKDLMRQGACDLSDLDVVVLDEADHMADMGFLPDVTDILDKTRPDGQRLLFSATLDKDVDVLVKRYLHDPVTHAIGPVDEPVATMDHHLLLIAPRDKNAVTAEIANREGRTILFVRTKHGVDRLAKQLAQVGVRAAGLHGGKSQGLRTRTLEEFREGTLNVLVATDVAARGIHVDDVTLVLHIDPPADHKGYMHRAGRTARAGERGTVVTLVLPHQVRSTTAMTRRAGVNAARTKVTAGDHQLVQLTGARTPSGEPITEPIIPERPQRARAGRRNGDRSRSHQPRAYRDRPRRHDDRPRGQGGDRTSTDRPRRYDDGDATDRPRGHGDAYDGGRRIGTYGERGNARDGRRGERGTPSSSPRRTSSYGGRRREGGRPASRA